MVYRNKDLGKLFVEYLSNNKNIYKVIDSWIRDSSNVIMNLSNQKV